MTTVNSPRGLSRRRCDLRWRADQHLLVALGELASGGHRGGWAPARPAPPAGPSCGAAPRTAPAAARRTPRRPTAGRAPWRARMPAGTAGSRRRRSRAPPPRTGQRPPSPPPARAPPPPMRRPRAQLPPAGRRDPRRRACRRRWSAPASRPQPSRASKPGRRPAPLCALKDCVGVRAPTWASSRAASRGVLGHHQVGGPQRLGGAWRQVAQVADRRADHEEPASGHRSRREPGRRRG